MYTAKDYDRALLAPDEVFQQPMDVVTTESMTPVQKLTILKHWEADARDLQVATEENMSGPSPSRLAEVRKAIDLLCERENLTEQNIT